MPCCDVRIALFALAMLVGCDNSPKPKSPMGYPPPAHVEMVQDDGQEVVYHWEHHGEDTPCLIPLPNRTTLPVTLRFRQISIDGSQIGVLFFDSEYSIEVGKILSDQVLIFVRPGEVIPYHDQLYHINFDNDSLDIKLVTESVPKAFHPSPKHLVVTCCEDSTIRKRLYDLMRDDWSDYERVRVTRIAEDASYAEYEGKPYYGSAQGVTGDKQIEVNEVVHQWAGSTTDIAMIVPPMEIEGVGRLRGWVEFRQTLSSN